MSDRQFDQVIAAVASYNRQPKPLTPEQAREQREAHRKQNPLHIKAVAKRRKRKRGGPK